jgi:hypothetical protein
MRGDSNKLNINIALKKRISSSYLLELNPTKEINIAHPSRITGHQHSPTPLQSLKESRE